MEGGRLRSSSTRLPRRDSIVEFMRSILEGSDEDKDSTSGGSMEERVTATCIPNEVGAHVNNSSAAMAPALGSCDMPRPPSRQSTTADQQSGSRSRQTTMQDNIFSDVSPAELGNYLLDPDGDDRMQGQQPQRQEQYTESDQAPASFTSRVADVGNRTTDHSDFTSWSTFGLHGTSASAALASSTQRHPGEGDNNGGGARRAASLDFAPQRPRDEYNELQASPKSTSSAAQREEDSYLQAAGLPFHQPLGPFGEEEKQYQKHMRKTGVDEDRFHSSLPNLDEEDGNAKRRKLMMSARKAVSDSVLGSGSMYMESSARRSSDIMSPIASSSYRNPIVTTGASTDTNSATARDIQMRHEESHSSTNSHRRASLQGRTTTSANQGIRNVPVPIMYVSPFQQQQGQQYQRASASYSVSSPPPYTSLTNPTARPMGCTTTLPPIPQNQFGFALTPENKSQLLLQQQVLLLQQQTVMQNFPQPPLGVIPAASRPTTTPIVLGPNGLPQPQQLSYQQYQEQLAQRQVFRGSQLQHPQAPMVGVTSYPEPQDEDDEQVTKTKTTETKNKGKGKGKEDHDESPSFERKPLSASFDAVPLVPPPIPLSEELGSTMTASQASQQSIHDWDRAMGLRRSHSKTMRASQRSRKKLQEVRAIQDMFGAKELDLVMREERAKTA